MTQESEPERRPSLLTSIPLILVLAGVAVGLVLISLDHWRRGTAMLGVSAALAGLLRLVLPTTAMGYLISRSKAFDVGFSALLAAGAAFLIIDP